MINWISGHWIDVAIYSAMACLFFVGFAKCIIPVRANAARLRRASRQLETPTPVGGKPVWQESSFLGKHMQTPWKRFLKNAEQLDARGRSCNVEDYINDDSVIHSVGHTPLSEMLPGLFTSLGILGTFIGLMNGLGGLDVSNAEETMKSIPQMIGGMTFAFTTSIVGVACSIAFNIFHRSAVGGAVNAIDDFYDAFNSLVMACPLDDNVTLILQQEDREETLRGAADEMSRRLSENVAQAVSSSLTPVTVSMNRFIMGQTQAQMDGLAAITQQFIAQMNRSLSGQLTALADTLNNINQSQSVTYEALQRTMSSADVIMRDMGRVQSVTADMMARFEKYLDSMAQSQQNNDAFLSHASQVLSGLMAASDEQNTMLLKLKAQQDSMSSGFREVARLNEQAMEAVRAQAGSVAASAGNTASLVEKNTADLANTYSSFVRKVGEDLGREAENFEKNICGVMNAMNENLERMKTQAAGGDGAGFLEKAAEMQAALDGIRAAVEKLASGKAAGGEEN